MPFFKKNIFISFINNLAVDHPTPMNISFFWNFGSLAMLALGVQIVSGILLAMYYIPHIDYAFFKC